MGSRRRFRNLIRDRQNEQVRKVFRTIFITLAGFLLAEIVAQETAQGIVEKVVHG